MKIGKIGSASSLFLIAVITVQFTLMSSSEPSPQNSKIIISLVQNIFVNIIFIVASSLAAFQSLLFITIYAIYEILQVLKVCIIFYLLFIMSGNLELKENKQTKAIHFFLVQIDKFIISRTRPYNTVFGNSHHNIITRVLSPIPANTTTSKNTNLYCSPFLSLSISCLQVLFSIVNITRP